MYKFFMFFMYKLLMYNFLMYTSPEVQHPRLWELQMYQCRISNCKCTENISSTSVSTSSDRTLALHKYNQETKLLETPKKVYIMILNQNAMQISAHILFFHSFGVSLGRTTSSCWLLHGILCRRSFQIALHHCLWVFLLWFLLYCLVNCLWVFLLCFLLCLVINCLWVLLCFLVSCLWCLLCLLSLFSFLLFGSLGCGSSVLPRYSL